MKIRFRRGDALARRIEGVEEIAIDAGSVEGTVRRLGRELPWVEDELLDAAGRLKEEVEIYRVVGDRRVLVGQRAIPMEGEVVVQVSTRR